MPDISMCNNSKCPLREDCYRFKAKPGYYQTYADFEYDEEEGCDYFMKIY